MTYNQDELRIIAISSAVWTRMLEDRMKRILDKVHGEFRAGKTDHLASLAELACVRDQLQEIKSAINQLENSKG